MTRNSPARPTSAAEPRCANSAATSGSSSWRKRQLSVPHRSSTAAFLKLVDDVVEVGLAQGEYRQQQAAVDLAADDGGRFHH